MPQKHRVLISDSLSGRGVEVLSRSAAIEVDVKTGLSAEELKRILPAYEGLVVRSATKVTADVLEAAGRLRIIGRAGIGVDNIDVQAASRRGIIVENTPSGNAVTTAEHALCLLLALARKIPMADATMKQGKWEKKLFSGVELTGKTLGIVGLGNIGRIVAERARGLKMSVVAYDPFLGKEAARAVGAELVPLEDVFKRCDFLTIHTPLNAETRGLVGEKAFDLMKDGVLVVNAARGGIVDEKALLFALERGKVAGAALDVFEKEPPDPDSPLVRHPAVICTPHLGASTGEAQEKVAVEVAEQLVAFFERGEVKNAVNIPPVRPEDLPRLQPWLDLAARLGSLVGQLHPRGSGIDEVKIEVLGDVADLGVNPVSRACLAGLLRTFMDLPINEVNAPFVAGDRGIHVVEVRTRHGATFSNAVAIRTRGASGVRYVKGTLFQVGEQFEPRVVQIDQFTIDVPPAGRILFLRNADRPGVIGAVGTLLGQRGINVASLHVGDDKASHSAIMLWTIDAELEAAALDEIKNLPHVESAQQVTL